MQSIFHRIIKPHFPIKTYITKSIFQLTYALTQLKYMGESSKLQKT